MAARGGMPQDQRPDAGRRDSEIRLRALEDGGFTLGAVTTDGTTALAVGTGFFAALVDPGPRPFAAVAIGVRARDAGLGQLRVALFRALPEDITEGAFLARRRVTLGTPVPLTASLADYLVELPEPVQVDRRTGFYWIGIQGSAAGAVVVGSNFGGPYSRGWTIAVPGATMPETFSRVTSTRTHDVASALLLSLNGQRILG